VTYLGSIFCTLSVIILTNLLIVTLYAGDLLTGNFTILQENILIFSLSIPATWWFALQAISFFIVAWFFTTKDKLMRAAARETFFRFYPKSISEKFQKIKYSQCINVLFLMSVIFFIISIPLTLLRSWNLVNNWPLIGAIIIVQIGIYMLMNDFFSANIVVRLCFRKLYQLNLALTKLEKNEETPEEALNKEAEEIYHITRLFLPVKTNEWIISSHYLLIPNVAYCEEEYQDLLTRHLIAVF